MQIPHPRAGDIVRVRRRLWHVERVDQFVSCQVVALRPASGHGARRRVILPFDDVEAARPRRVRRVSRRRWRRICLALVAEHASGALRATAGARVEVLPYQLEPALALLRGDGCRLLLADEVGLGKTVQAMLAVSELRARGLASRVLVLCPAGLRRQWADEWLDRVGQHAVVLDHAGLRGTKARLAPAENPWATVPLAVASIDYVKRPEVYPALAAAPWDVVVIDEAHGVCGDSERHAAAADLCRRTPYVLLLSATPHSGDDAAFRSLCALGRHDDGLIVFRRSRQEAGRDSGRRVQALRVRPSALEFRMHAALRALTAAVRREHARMDPHAWLVLTLLHKRAFSSAFALAASVERRLAALGDADQPPVEQLALPWDADGADLDAADSAPMWGQPALQDAGRERHLLTRVLEAARAAVGDEGKLRRLRRLLHRVREPVIVFTEYRDTLAHVRTQAAPDAVAIHGGMSVEQRRAALDAFPTAGVLLATDAAGEGLNLHAHCRTVVNLELPWNPMRLEQRIGRVDRIGQRRRVHAVHLVARGTQEEDLLDRLSLRVSRAAASVGAPDPLTARPAWTEDASARLVVLDEETAPAANAGTRASPASTTVPLTRMVEAAADAAARIARVRRLLASARADSVSPTTLPTEGPVVARTRRSGTRATLDGRACAVFRTRLADGSGRVVAARLDAVACRIGGAPRVAAAAMDRDAPTFVEVDRAWADDAAATHRAMVAACLRRLQAIDTLRRVPSGEAQPGLFDRRVASSAALLAHEHARADACHADRIAAVSALFDLHTDGPALAALLVPHSSAS